MPNMPHEVGETETREPMSAFPEVLYKFPHCAGKPFIPSNGTEGDMFMEEFCFQCIHERWTHRQKEDRDEDKCGIMNRALLYDTKDPEYPKEWVFTAEGWPVCTSWKKFDWGTRDDPHEPPPPPEPEDPRQLMMPFDITELFPFGDVVVTRTAIVERAWLEELANR